LQILDCPLSLISPRISFCAFPACNLAAQPIAASNNPKDPQIQGKWHIPHTLQSKIFNLKCFPNLNCEILIAAG
jgi:hypothetical protein